MQTGGGSLFIPEDILITNDNNKGTTSPFFPILVENFGVNKLSEFFWLRSLSLRHGKPIWGGMSRIRIANIGFITYHASPADTPSYSYSGGSTDILYGIGKRFPLSIIGNLNLEYGAFRVLKIGQLFGRYLSRFLSSSGGTYGRIGSSLLRGGLYPHLLESLVKLPLVLTQNIAGGVRGLSSRERCILCSPYLVSSFRQTIAGELPLAMHIPQLQARSDSQNNRSYNEGHGSTDKPSVKRYLIIFVLSVMCLIFGSLALFFALNLKDGDAVFKVNIRLFIIFFLVVQSCAILLGN